MKFDQNFAMEFDKFLAILTILLIIDHCDHKIFDYNVILEDFFDRPPGHKQLKL